LVANKAYADGPAKVVIQRVNSAEYPQIKAAVEVVDGNGIPITGLTRKDIAVFENNTPVSTATFDSSVDVSLPLGVMLVLDTSGSMKGVPLADAKAAASTFLDHLAEQDQAALVTFSSAVTVVKDLTANKNEVKQALNSAQAVGETRLYDALYIAVEKLTAAEIPRKIIVLLTDGEDTKSDKKVKDGVQLASKGGILVFTVGIGPSINKADLDFIAEQTGGTSIYSPSSAAVTQAFQAISQRLKSYYVLTYTTSLRGEPAQRTLAVDVVLGSQKISGRQDFTLEFSPVSFEVTSPGEGQKLEEDFSIEVAVNQPQMVAEMAFLLDGIFIHKLSSPPYSVPIEISSLLKGSHTITVTVRDAFGVEKSKRVTFTIPGAGEPSPSTPSAQTTAEPRWLSALKGVARHPSLPVGVALSILGVGGLVREIVTKVRGTRCPICGLTYRDKGGCPRCLGHASNPRRPLGQMLVWSKLITPNELSSSLADSLAQNRRLGEVLVEKGLLSEDALTKALRMQQKRSTFATRRDGVAYGEQAKAKGNLGLIFYPVILCIGVLLLLLFQYNIP
jgi:Ca-activated chloride channel family protein